MRAPDPKWIPALLSKVPKPQNWIWSTKNLDLSCGGRWRLLARDNRGHKGGISRVLLPAVCPLFQHISVPRSTSCLHSPCCSPSPTCSLLSLPNLPLSIAVDYRIQWHLVVTVSGDYRMKERAGSAKVAAGISGARGWLGCKLPLAFCKTDPCSRQFLAHCIDFRIMLLRCLTKRLSGDVQVLHLA